MRSSLRTVGQHKNRAFKSYEYNPADTKRVAFLPRIKRDRDTVLALGLWMLYASMLLLVARRSHLAILANDAFPLLFQASSLSWSDPRSFYNGFFPIGYPGLLRVLLLFGRQHVDATGVLVNIALALPVIWCLLKLLASQGWSRWWAVLATTVAMLLPEMLRGVLSLRPDFIVTVLATAAFLCMTKHRYGLAGALLGASCLFRTHALVLVIAFAIALLIFQNWRSAARVLLFSAPFLLLQAVINLAAGESPFSSSQGFNIAKMMYGADWRQEGHAMPGAIDIILQEPLVLLRAYSAHLMTEWYLLAPLLISLFFKQTREYGLTGLLYLLGVGLGGSPRGSLPIQPIVIVCLFALLSTYADRARAQLVPAAMSLLIFAGASVVLYRAAANAGARIERYQDVGDRLGMRHVGDAKQVLTDDFAMYFPQIENASPYANGGWGPIGIPLYRERMPQFMYDDPKELHDSLASHGVTFIVLSQPSSDPGLEATVVRDTHLFNRQPNINRYAVYKVR